MNQKEKIQYNLKQYFLQNNIPFTDDNLYELLKKNCDTDGVKAVDAF